MIENIRILPFLFIHSRNFTIYRLYWDFCDVVVVVEALRTSRTSTIKSLDYKNWPRVIDHLSNLKSCVLAFREALCKADGLSDQREEMADNDRGWREVGPLLRSRSLSKGRAWRRVREKKSPWACYTWLDGETRVPLPPPPLLPVRCG